MTKELTTRKASARTLRGRQAVHLVLLQICAIFTLLCLGATVAFAQEVPIGTTTVRISVVLPIEAAIAGGEVGFTQTSGLQYTRFIPATGVQNPVKATVGDTTYVGFFSADNRYEPATGGFVMGDLEFSYGGDSPEQVTLQEMSLHTKVGDGVDTRTLSPSTTYSVTRASGSSGGNGDGGGSGNNGGGNGNSGGGSGTNTGTNSGGSGGGTGQVGTTGAGNTTSTGDDAVAELTPDRSAATSNTGNTANGGTTPSGSGNTSGTDITDTTTPLAPVSPASEDTTSTFSLWWIVGGVVLLALVVLAIAIFWRRRQRQQEEAGGHHSRYE